MEYITIIEKDEYKITKNKKDYNIFNIFFCNTNSNNIEKLIKSFVKTKIITGATITNNYTLVTFNAKTKFLVAKLEDTKLVFSSIL